MRHTAHGRGLYASKELMSGDFVLNYEGDIVSPSDLKQRERGRIRQNGRGVVPHTLETRSSV